MVALPLFKLAALFVRQVSKVGANRIKVQAHEHERFRKFAVKYGQIIHQLNMRLNVALLRNVEAEMRAKEKAEAPTVKTKEQVEKEKDKASKISATASATSATATVGGSSVSSSPSTSSSSSSTSSGPSHSSPSHLVSVWRRKFRPLPEAKAVDLFADVVGDAFILSVGIVLVLYEWWRSSQKPDANQEKLKAMSKELEDLRAKEEAQEDSQRQQKLDLEALRDEFRILRENSTHKKSLLSLGKG